MIADLLKKKAAGEGNKSFSHIIGSAPSFQGKDALWPEFAYKTRSWMEAHFPLMAKELMRWAETQGGEITEFNTKAQCENEDMYEETKQIQAK